MAFHFDILTGHASGLSKRFDQNAVTLGRDPDADVGFHPTLDTAVSRGVHARIFADPAGGGAARLEVLHASGVGIVGPGGAVSRRVGQGETIDLPAQAELEIGVNGPRVRVADLSQPLPGTEDERGQGMLPEARVSAGMRKQVGATHRGLKVTAVVGLLAVVAAVLAYAAISGRVTKTEVGLELTAAEIAQLNRDVSELRIDPPAPLTAALDKAAPSVWVIGLVGKDGSFTGVGTGWAVAKGKLATNAHVVDFVQRKLKGGEGLTAVAQHDGTGTERLRLSAPMVVHPGYRMWEAEQDRPIFCRSPIGDGIDRVSLIHACDVGLVTVAEGNEGPALPLAADGALTVPGSAIGYVGYPMEGLPGFPARQSVMGTLSARTDYFFGMEKQGERLLVHHTALTRGGSSGSPLINARGEVIGIHSAGAVLAENAQGERINAGVQYGHGVSLVRELLAGEAEAAQATRGASWRKASDELQLAVKDANVLWGRAMAGGAKAKSVLASTDVLKNAGPENLVKYPAKLGAGQGYIVSVFAASGMPVQVVVCPMKDGNLLKKKEKDKVTGKEVETLIMLGQGRAEGSPLVLELDAPNQPTDAMIFVWLTRQPPAGAAVSTALFANAPRE